MLDRSVNSRGTEEGKAVAHKEASRYARWYGTIPPPRAGEGQGGGWGLFHVANAGACSRFEFARAIVAGSVEVVPISTAEAGRVAPRPAYSALSSTRWPATGLPALSTWELALERFLKEKQAPEH